CAATSAYPESRASRVSRKLGDFLTPPNRLLIAGAPREEWACWSGEIIPERMSKSCSGVVSSVTRGRFAATTAAQSTFFSLKNPYCSAQVWAKTSKFESGVLGVGASQTAGFRSILWTIMSDAAYARCTRASFAVLPGRITYVTGVPGRVNAARAPAG